MSDNLGLGKIITTPQQKDAIHVAVAPVKAAVDLHPGQWVGLNMDVEACDVLNPIGIVDPFLAHKVCKGETFWMYLKPGSITSLRHDWTHPAFNGDEAVSESIVKRSEAIASRRWLENFARNNLSGDLSYEELLDAAKEYNETGKMYCFGRDLNGNEYTDEEFWTHFDNVTGIKPRSTDNFFRCAY